MGTSWTAERQLPHPSQTATGACRDMHRLRALVDEGILPPVEGLILNQDYIRHSVQGSTAYQLFWATEYDRFKEQEAAKDAGHSTRITTQRKRSKSRHSVSPRRPSASGSHQKTAERSASSKCKAKPKALRVNPLGSTDLSRRQAGIRSISPKVQAQQDPRTSCMRKQVSRRRQPQTAQRRTSTWTRSTTSRRKVNGRTGILQEEVEHRGEIAALTNHAAL